MADNAIDLITRKVTEQFEGALSGLRLEADALRRRGDELLATLEAEGRDRMDEFFAELPMRTVSIPGQVAGFEPVEWIKEQAKSRAWRTLIQAFLAVVLTAFGNAIVQSIANPDFEFFSWADWKVAIALAGSAVLTAAISYGQNKLGIKPPKV